MKIYSWKNLLLGLLVMALALWRLWMCLRTGFDGSFLPVTIMAVLLSCRCLYAALNKEGYERDKATGAAYKQACRSLFGKWAAVVSLTGPVLIMGALYLALLEPNLGGIALFLLLGGSGYSMVVGHMVKKQMEKESEKG